MLARQGDLVLLVHPAGGAFTDRLLDLLTRTARAGESGHSFADLVSAECEANAAAPAPGDDEGPAAVAFGPAAVGTAFTVYGTAWAEVTTTRGVQRLGTGEPYGRLTYVLPSTVIKVRAGVRPPSSVGDTDPYLRLADGVVRAVAFVYAPAEVPPGTQPPAAAEPSAPAQSPAQEQPPPSPEPADDSALSGGAVASGAAEVADLADAADMAEMSGATSVDPAWHDQAVTPAPPAPAPLDPNQDPNQDPSQDPFLSATSVDPAWHDQAVTPAPPAPGSVDSDFGGQGGQGDQAAQALVHSPTSLDISWRDQAPTPEPPGPAPVDAGFGEPGAPFGAGPQALGDPYGQGGQGGYEYGAGPGEQADFVSLPLGGQPAEEMPRRDPLPLGAEPLGDQAISPAEGLAPLVTGIYCKNGHFDDPEARYCAVCGIGMAQLTKIPQEGRRPPLGVLILDDGSVCQLDTDYVVGREPTLDKAVAEGRARPLRLGGAPDLVSRIHARVELEGWDVFVSDLNSANGTLLVLPGETTGTKLAPGVRTPLIAGSQIRLGDAYALRYDSHRHR